MKIKNAMIRLLAGLVIFMIAALPSFGADYLIMQKRGFTDRSFSYLNPSTDTMLRQAGIKSDRIKNHLVHIDALTADISKEDAQKLKLGNEELVLVRADTMLYHSRTTNQVMKELAVSDIPWHVLKAHPLQDYAKEENANTDSVLIFVLDTGVDLDHPELEDNLEMEWAKHFYKTISGISSDNDLSDLQGHGSQVIGTIVGNSTGVAPSINVVPIRAATDSGGLSVELLSAACDYIIGLKENQQLAGKNFIINLSYNSSASFSPSNDLSDYFDALFNSLEEKNILFIGSAGNDGKDSDSNYVYPTSNEAANYVASASVSSDGSLSYFSNYGIETVELAAPGSSIYTTDRSGSYITVDGTSFASPFTAGIAGLIWSIDPDLKYWEVRNLLINAVYGQQVETSFIEDHSGNYDDFLNITSQISTATYENNEIPVIAGKPLFPAMVTDRPYAPSPANGEEHVAFDRDLEWDSHYEVASYDIWFGNSPDSLELISENMTQTYYSIPDIENKLGKLLYETNYYWQVDTTTDTNTFEGILWRFKTLSLKTYDQYPVNGAQNIATSLNLSWRSDIPGSIFDVYLSTDRDAVREMNNSVLLASGLSSPSVGIQGLDFNTTYYWRVVTNYDVDPDRLMSSATSTAGDVLAFKTGTESIIPDDDDIIEHFSSGGGCSTGIFVPSAVLLLVPVLLSVFRR